LAAKEATRLAGLQKGKEFGVYVMTQKVSEPAPSYKHEWQRFAAKGEKISAIKELRSVTGLGLKSAKDAVDHWIAHDEPYSRIAA
jgi:ribosomal protein L7/L12